MQTKLALVTAALAIGIAAPASAQIERGDVVYIEGEDGQLELYRRIDRPHELDGRAHFSRVPIEEQEAMSEVSAARVIPVIDRSAVVRRTSAMAGGAAPSGSAVVVAEPGDTGASASYPEPIVVPAVEMERSPVRFRLGASALGGATLGNSVDDPEGWMAGLALRAGAQLSDWFAIYYQPVGILSGLETTSAGGDFDEAFTLWNSLLIETTLFDFVSIGAGPSVDFYFGCDRAIQGQASCADEGAFFGLHGRAAVNLGGMMFGHRGAVSLSFDIHPTWFDDESETLAMLGGVGVELF